MLHNLVRCRACGTPLSFFPKGERNCCQSPLGSKMRGAFLIHDPTMAVSSPEMLVRDQDALNYLSHPKFPSQITRLEHFIQSHPKRVQGGKVLDLGCGTGPTTDLLLQASYEIVAVDFSIRSLSVNAQLCGNSSMNALFVQGDLNVIEFENNSFDGLMMADFLQHLGNQAMQRAFLHKVFDTLKPGGWFYLSFFNMNLFHRLKGDLEGVHGNIGYRRMSLGEVRNMLPKSALIERESVMNIFYHPGLDNLALRLPFAPCLARMAVIEGCKGE